MGIALTTDDESRTTVVINDIVSCGAAFAGQMSWLLMTDSHGNRFNLHMPRERARRLHEAWAATAIDDASDLARTVA